MTEAHTEARTALLGDKFLSSEVGRRICKLIGVDPAMVNRIIVDVVAGEPVEVEVRFIADTRLIIENWASEIHDAVITPE